MVAALACQLILLGYHQATTLVDLHPYNGVRFSSGRERHIEAAVNGILMCLGPVGYAFRLHGLMLYGAIYYFVLFAVEVVIWWIPYFTAPAGKWRSAYNFLLACVTAGFEPGDALDRWLGVHKRVHGSTLFVLPMRSGRIVPNLEHMLLHGWTLITAFATLSAYLTSQG